MTVPDHGNVLVPVERAELAPGQRHRLCLECPYWYGAEDDEYGPCSLKTARNEPRFMTFGTWACDEGFVEPAGLEAGEGGIARLGRTTTEAEKGGGS